MTSDTTGDKVPHMGNASPDEGDFLTTAQVAALTGWSITSINRWASEDVLPSRKLPGRTGPRLFALAAVNRLREQRGEQVPA